MPSSAADPPRERPWLHWGLVVTGLYLLWFVALTVPLVATCFVTISDLKQLNSPASLIEVYESWPYWIVVGALCLSQFLFLRVPVRLATKRPTSRRSVWLPIGVAGFWFGLLVWGGGLTITELFQKDILDHSDQLEQRFWWVVGIAVASWSIWAVVFFCIARAREPREVIAQQSRWLIRGSILELLIAVPSHIVARGRGDCCAGFLTFCGITMGLTVMLLAFGPAVLLLYHARWLRLKGRH